MALVRGKEVPTIDCALVTIKPATGSEIAIDTSNKIAVEVSLETVEAIKLIIKNKLLAQKPQNSTITGHAITLTDNVFNYQLAKILQGGTIQYDAVDTQKITGYTPPLTGSGEKGEVFELNAYSSIYDASGLIIGYEKITYPNCQGNPFGLSSEDGVFRVSEYVINSAPAKGQAPYVITLVDTLPTITA